VSALEDRLRDAYRAVADTVDPSTILGVPEKTEPRAAVSRRNRFIMPLAAAAAVILVVVLTTISVGIPHGHSSRAAKTRAPAAAGLPAFTVVSQGSSLKVFNTGTGAAGGTLAAPPGLEFGGVASGGTSQTFLAFANPVSVTAAACHAYYYRFRLTAAGTPQGLTLLRSIAGSAASAIAASPGGGTYAYSAVHCLTAPPNGLIGISGQAGNHTWAYDEGDNYTFSLAATAGAKELVLSLMDEDNWANLLLNTGSGSATVDAASRIVPAVPYAQTLAISPNGATLYACVSGDQTGQLAAYSAATGRLIRVLYKWTLAQASVNFCQVSADATGTLLLASFYSTNLGKTAPSTSLIAINPQAGTAVKLPISADLVQDGVGAAW
jgi:hypothetical protein